MTICTLKTDFKQKKRICILFQCQELFFSTSPASQYACLLFECELCASTSHTALWSKSYMVREAIMLTEDDVEVNELTSVIEIASIIMFRVFEKGDQSAYFECLFFVCLCWKKNVFTALCFKIYLFTFGNTLYFCFLLALSSFICWRFSSQARHVLVCFEALYVWKWTRLN